MEENLRNEIAQLELQQQEYSLLRLGSHDCHMMSWNVTYCTCHSQRLSIKEKIEQEYNGVTETVVSVERLREPIAGGVHVHVNYYGNLYLSQEHIIMRTCCRGVHYYENLLQGVHYLFSTFFLWPRNQN